MRQGQWRNLAVGRLQPNHAESHPRHVHSLPHSRTEASILIVDDADAWRTQLRNILEKQQELQIVGEACNGRQAIQQAAELKPDLILLDIGMPVLNGLEAAIEIQRISSQSTIVFVTQENDADIRAAAIATGARGYVLKSNAASELLPAIRGVLHNGHLVH